MARRKNPSVPVLLMNPSYRMPGGQLVKVSGRPVKRRRKTAAKKKRRRTVAAAAPKQRARKLPKGARRSSLGYTVGRGKVRRRKLNPRRRSRRRRNPSINFIGMAAAALAGAGLGAVAYGLQGQNLSPNVQTAILGIGGAAAGAVVSGWAPGIGAGIAGGAGALAAKRLLDQYMTSTESTTSAVMGRLYGGRSYRQLPRGARSIYDVNMAAVQADLNAVQAAIR